MSGTKVDFYLRRISLYITKETSIDTNTIIALHKAHWREYGTVVVSYGNIIILLYIYYGT